MSGRKIESIRWTIQKAATEFSVHRKTLTKGLRNSDAQPGEDKKFSTAQIVRAIFDDIKFENTRLRRGQADKAEIEAAKLRGEMVTTDAIFRAYEGIFIAVRQTVLASNLSDSEKADLLSNLRHDITEADPAN